MLTTLRKLFIRFTTGAALIMLLGVFVSVLVQVVSRRLVEAQVLWTDEVAKICFVWSVYLGAILVVEDDSLIRLDFIDSHLASTVRTKLHVLFRIITFGTVLVGVPASIQLVLTNINYRLSFTKIPYAWLYASGFVFFVSITIVSVAKLISRSTTRQP